MSQSQPRMPTRDEFAALLDDSVYGADRLEGTVVRGHVIAIEKDMAVIDIGLKAEGRIPIKEFVGPNREASLNVGDEVDVFLDRVENALGEAIISREKARREESWAKLEICHERNERVNGAITSMVKGGYTVELESAIAFLPRSQVDIRPVRDINTLFNVIQPFHILKMDRRRGNIVVSRRMVLEESRAEARTEIVANLVEGQIIDGTVKNVTEYGAFVDLGGIDGLLHVTDMSWKRVNHPTEVVSIGQVVKVQIVKINPDTHRISLGMKQLLADPWQGVAERYPIGHKVSGRITNVTDYGAFVEIETGVEGLIHVSEMSWTKKNQHPSKIVAIGQEVEAAVLEIDASKRRISLGMKQAMQNPWHAFAEKYPVGSIIEGEVKNKTEFGLFVGISNDIDGMVHLNDLDWNKPGDQALADYNKGDVVRAVVTDIDTDKERVALSIKQVSSAGLADYPHITKNSVVTCEVLEVKDTGIEVKIVDTELTTFIKRSDLARDRDEQRPDRFAVGEKVDARVENVDRKNARVQLSIKAMQIADEKTAIAQYGSSDSGASLGDILGAALKRG
jgi:small subunit ribosomal protein S1